MLACTTHTVTFNDYPTLKLVYVYALSKAKMIAKFVKSALIQTLIKRQKLNLMSVNHPGLSIKYSKICILCECFIFLLNLFKAWKEKKRNEVNLPSARNIYWRLQFNSHVDSFTFWINELLNMLAWSHQLVTHSLWSHLILFVKEK